ncbi:hypothetical protein ABZP36_015374 [Zizania latifolia]
MEAAPQGTHQRHLHHQAAGGFSDPPSPLQPPLSPASAAAAALANARWTPTKEQIAVLEGLYRQGLRTPTAEQIQQITARLREHGHIEGKNVFYWFQNHKARQRQKQKQQSFDYFSKLLRRPPPLPVLHRPLVRPIPLPMPAPAMPPACNTGGVMYRTQSFMPAAAPATANAGYYSQQQQQQQVTPVLYPGMEVSPPHDKGSAQPPANTMYPTAPPNSAHFTPPQGRGAGRETLQLFPLQNTFVLPDSKARRGGGGSACAVSLSTPTSAPAPASFSGEVARSSDSPNNSEAPPFYDFFGVHSGGR